MTGSKDSAGVAPSPSNSSDSTIPGSSIEPDTSGRSSPALTALSSKRMSKQMGLITSRVKSFFRSSKRGSKKIFVTQMNRPSIKDELSTVESEGQVSERSVNDPDKGMSARDLAHYELEQIETVKANGEKSVRMQFARRNSQYHQGASVLKNTTSSPTNESRKGRGKRNLHGWRTQRRLNIENSLKEQSISERGGGDDSAGENYEDNGLYGTFDPNESGSREEEGGSSRGGSREYGYGESAPPSTISLDGEDLGIVEYHKHLELDCINNGEDGDGGEGDAASAIYLPTTPGPSRIRRKSLSDLTDLAVDRQPVKFSPPGSMKHLPVVAANQVGGDTGGGGDGSGSESGVGRNDGTGSLRSQASLASVSESEEPDVDHIKVRIHPGLIVNVIENVLNFDKDEDEGGGQVIGTDIWYTKDEISEFRVQGNEEQFQEELTTAQDNMKRLVVNKDDPNYKKEMEMSKMIAKLLETDWEEGMSKSDKSGKQTWDKGGGESGGSTMFYMGDDGRATFENEDDAEEDRTWETDTARRRERRRTRGTFTVRSRRGTKVDLSKEGGSNRNSMGENDLKDIIGQAKAETVAAIMAVEALNFSDDDAD
ncbi:hypothetical protein TrST_g2711 [Triparma strigata]|uniref:Uncharacterized protein n=1 Tax=Triparma strigata TaxID=1606541 RepID=A0A9W7BVC4_9STRA|nr:hypothetical protein TrST_g2711 [Triparma strigata]